ncbi:MAG: OmpA family protein [Deltaproteobacteria bacterium]|nr:OmpA family protein [Deltaproteobacteria bacterium]
MSRCAACAARRIFPVLFSVLCIFVAGCGNSYQVPGSEQRIPVTPKARANAEAGAAEGIKNSFDPGNAAGLEGWSLEEKQAATFIYSAPIFFYTDSAALTEQAKQVLGQKAEKIKAFPAFKVIIAGHCDERGTDAYNYALGGRRAKAALDYLVGLGVPRAQLDSVSYGKSSPQASGRDEAGMSRNRRDDFHVSKR